MRRTVLACCVRSLKYGVVTLAFTEIVEVHDPHAVRVHTFFQRQDIPRNHLRQPISVALLRNTWGVYSSADGTLDITSRSSCSRCLPLLLQPRPAALECLLGTCRNHQQLWPAIWYPFWCSQEHVWVCRVCFFSKNDRTNFFLQLSAYPTGQLSLTVKNVDNALPQILCTWSNSRHNRKELFYLASPAGLPSRFSP